MITTYKSIDNSIIVKFKNGKLQSIKPQNKCDVIDWEGMRHDIPFWEDHASGCFKKLFKIQYGNN